MGAEQLNSCRRYEPCSDIEEKCGTALTSIAKDLTAEPCMVCRQTNRSMASHSCSLNVAKFFNCFLQRVPANSSAWIGWTGGRLIQSVVAPSALRANRR